MEPLLGVIQELAGALGMAEQKRLVSLLQRRSVDDIQALMASDGGYGEFHKRLERELIRVEQVLEQAGNHVRVLMSRMDEIAETLD